MANKLQQFITQEYTSREVPDFRVGDVVRVHQLVPDIKAYEVGQKLSKTAKAAMKAAKKKVEETSRVQIFEGVVIAKKHGTEPGATFTVRKIAAGNIGVEKIFPLYSPLVKKVEIMSRPKVRRAKLYFLRDRFGKQARKISAGVTVDQQVTSVGELQVPKSEEDIASDEVATEAETTEAVATQTQEETASSEPAVEATVAEETGDSTKETEVEKIKEGSEDESEKKDEA